MNESINHMVSFITHYFWPEEPLWFYGRALRPKLRNNAILLVFVIFGLELLLELQQVGTRCIHRFPRPIHSFRDLISSQSRLLLLGQASW